MIKFSTLLLSTLLLSPSWSYGGSNTIIQLNGAVAKTLVRAKHSCKDPVVKIVNQGTNASPLQTYCDFSKRSNTSKLSPLAIASQNHTPVRGTRVSLIKPEGFTPAKNYSGFEQTNTGASIIITEMPAPYSQIAAGLNAANLKTRGMTLLKKESITIDGYSGQLLKVTQVANFTDFVKWLVVFGDETETVIIVASLPQELENNLSQPLTISIISAKWDRNKVIDLLADINFTVEITPNFKVTQQLQNALAYTKNGVIPTESPEEPIFIVAPSLSKIRVQDRKQFSENRLAQTAQIENLSIETSKEISINGLSGYEIIAKASDRDTNIPLVVYQVMLFDNESYYIIQGLVGEKLKAEYLDDFHTMARSFKRKIE